MDAIATWIGLTTSSRIPAAGSRTPSPASASDVVDNRAGPTPQLERRSEWDRTPPAWPKNPSRAVRARQRKARSAFTSSLPTRRPRGRDRQPLVRLDRPEAVGVRLVLVRVDLLARCHRDRAVPM